MSGVSPGLRGFVFVVLDVVDVATEGFRHQGFGEKVWVEPVLPPVARSDGLSTLDRSSGHQCQSRRCTSTRLHPVRILSSIVEGVVSIPRVAALGVFGIYVDCSFRASGDFENIPRHGRILLLLTEFGALIVCNYGAR